MTYNVTKTVISCDLEEYKAWLKSEGHILLKVEPKAKDGRTVWVTFKVCN